LGYNPDILILDPHDLDDILISIMDIAEKVDGRKLVVSLQKRINHIRMRSGHRRIGGGSNKNNDYGPKILCLEWINPFFTGFLKW
jgi:iron complex transport system substrate-binding protein